MLTALGLADRGAKQRALHVIRYAEAPAVLAELGFITNEREERLLVMNPRAGGSRALSV